MTYTAHTPVKPEHLAQAALELVERELIVPRLFVRKGVDDFRGALDDTLNMKVPGVLPAHDYAWRNDRSTPLTVDEYVERKVAVRFGGRAYSAVKLTDEQKEFDFGGWAPLLAAQGRAVARKLEYEAVNKMSTGDYMFTLGIKENNLLKDITEARRLLNRVGAPKEGRILLVGSDIETLLQTDEVLNRATGVGETLASTALATATLGKQKGFTIVSSEEIAPDEAFALTPGAFVFLNAAPSVPASVKDGHTTVGESGIAMRWMMDYDSTIFVDRSVVDTWYGYAQIKDPIAYWDAAKGHEVVSEELHNVRAIKLKLGATDVFPQSGDAKKVAKALGVEKRSKATTAA